MLDPLKLFIDDRVLISTDRYPGEGVDGCVGFIEDVRLWHDYPAGLTDLQGAPALGSTGNWLVAVSIWGSVRERKEGKHYPHGVAFPDRMGYRNVFFFYANELRMYERGPNHTGKPRSRYEVDGGKDWE